MSATHRSESYTNFITCVIAAACLQEHCMRVYSDCNVALEYLLHLTNIQDMNIRKSEL